jgi:CBS domain containing-hemolysin-like protein
MAVFSGVGLLAVALLVVANGFFVAAEFALVAARRSRIEQLAAEGNVSAKLAGELIRHLDAYIAACQLGITIASLALGWIGEPALARVIEPLLDPAVGRFAPAAAHAVAIAIAFTIITGLHIVLGELAPKGIALQRPEGTALWIARPLHLFYLALRWPIVGLNAVGNAVLRVIGLPLATEHHRAHSAEELRLLVNASEEAGLVQESEARIAGRAFAFGDLDAGALMTPRIALQAVPVSAGLDDVLGRFTTGRHYRLLVYADSLDDILGAIHLRDLIRHGPGAPFDLRALVQPVLTIPQSRRADDLLEDMRRMGRHVAVVVDEYGSTAGIITLADLLRALVGEVEEKGEQDASTSDLPRNEPDGSVLVDGLMRLHEFEEMLGEQIEDPAREEVTTLGGLIMTKLDRLPYVSDEIRVAGRRLRVEQLVGRRVGVARLFPLDRHDRADGSGSA